MLLHATYWPKNYRMVGNIALSILNLLSGDIRLACRTTIYWSRDLQIAGMKARPYRAMQKYVDFSQNWHRRFFFSIFSIQMLKQDPILFTEHRQQHPILDCEYVASNIIPNGLPLISGFTEYKLSDTSDWSDRFKPKNVNKRQCSPSPSPDRRRPKFHFGRRKLLEARESVRSVCKTFYWS